MMGALSKNAFARDGLGLFVDVVFVHLSPLFHGISILASIGGERNLDKIINIVLLITVRAQLSHDDVSIGNHLVARWLSVASSAHLTAVQQRFFEIGAGNCVS